MKKKFVIKIWAGTVKLSVPYWATGEGWSGSIQQAQKFSSEKNAETFLASLISLDVFDHKLGDRIFEINPIYVIQ